MEIQLQELVDKIKKEGIEATKIESAKLIANAETEAQEILHQAQQQANKIIAQAKEEAERTQKASQANIEQSCRNLLLSFKAEIQSLLDRIIANAVNSVYSEEVLKTVLPEILKSWANKNTDSLQLLIPEKHINKLEDSFKVLLSSTLKNGLEINVGKNIGAGFRIVERNGSAYYDFSADAVANLLSNYLNPRLANVLKQMEK